MRRPAIKPIKKIFLCLKHRLLWASKSVDIGATHINRIEWTTWIQNDIPSNSSINAKIQGRKPKACGPHKSHDPCSDVESLMCEVSKSWILNGAVDRYARLYAKYYRAPNPKGPTRCDYPISSASCAITIEMGSVVLAIAT